jgi:hypothetical protein
VTSSYDRWKEIVARSAKRTMRHSGQGVTNADRAFLRADNPELVDLRRRYAITKQIFGPPTIWHDGHVEPADILFFRGDNGFVWQYQDSNRHENYLLTYFYLKEITNDLFQRLREENDFGVFAFPSGEGDRLLSRDLLDSVNEILFLRRMGLAGLDIQILDIGAGYGRLAARLSAALDGVRTWCIDAVPESTFLCGFYLRRRGVEERASTIAFDRQEQLPAEGQIKLAVNIHSFSECPAKAIDYWLKRCAELAIEYLFIVPDGSAKGGELRRTDGEAFTSIVTAHGYALAHAEPKYANTELMRFGVSPAWYYLFRRAAAQR